MSGRCNSCTSVPLTFGRARPRFQATKEATTRRHRLRPATKPFVLPPGGGVGAEAGAVAAALSEKDGGGCRGGGVRCTRW